MSDSPAIGQQIDATVAHLLGFPEFECIRWKFGESWSGDPAIHFNVLISDRAAKNDLRRATKHATNELRAALYDLTERYMFFSFRSHSEQEALQDPEWMPLPVEAVR